MLKAIIIVCAICGTALLVKSEVILEQELGTAVSSPLSFQEMHANAHLEYLPVTDGNQPN
jgi:hypothetical protein